jgi:hypothetical protein
MCTQKVQREHTKELGQDLILSKRFLQFCILSFLRVIPR